MLDNFFIVGSVILVSLIILLIMINRIISETSITDPTIKKLSNTKYRVLLGPFNDIKKLEESFNNIKLLNFENLEILKDV